MTQPAPYTPLLEAALDNRRDQALRIVRELVDDARNVSSIIRQVIGPTLVSIGTRWENAEISVAQEHIASRIVAECLEALRLAVVPNPRLDAHAVIACVSSEYHELGARMVADLLELDGWRVDFLGAATPARDLADFVAQLQPDLVGLSATLRERIPDVRLAIRRLQDLDPAPTILVGGSEDCLQALVDFGATHDLGDIQLVHGDAVDALVAARELLTARLRPTTLDQYLAALGERLQRRRKARGWTQQYLARRASIDRTYISAVEHGRQNLTIAAIFKLADALEVGIQEILVGDEPRFRDLP